MTGVQTCALPIFSFLKSHSISIQSRPPVTTDHGLLGLNLTHEQIFSCPSNLCKYKHQNQYKGIQICDEFVPNLKTNIRKIMQCYTSHLLKVLLKMQTGNGNECNLKKQVLGSGATCDMRDYLGRFTKHAVC